MKRIFPVVLLWVFGSMASAGHLQLAVDKLIDEVDPAINISIAVVDLHTGETIYQRNANRALIPASNMKLFSDAAALMVLGPDYRFQSQLSTNASRLEEGVLKGSLYLHLPGDPSFTKQQLFSLLSALKQWGVYRIQGDVVLVSNHHNIDAYAPGWVREDLKYGYGAPLAPVMIDENRLLVTVNPAPKADQPAIVELSNQNAFSINNLVKTKAKGGACGVDYNMDNENRVTVRGCVGIGQWAIQQRMAIRNPLRYAQEVIKGQLGDLHIALDGRVVLGKAPHNLLLLASHDSKPIAQLLADTLKPSDNLYADSLYLHAAAKLYGSPLNWSQAQSVLKNFLQQQTGVSLQSAVLTDGSGLSRNDLLTAQQTVGLLRFLHERFPLAYEYISALPVAGFDGTLQRRFRKPSQQGLVRAKTGTMSGVVSLSGYLFTANAHTLAFAIFINSRPKLSPEISGRYRYLIDALCGFFLRQKLDFTRPHSLPNPHRRLAFQQQPTQADLQRKKRAKWRKFEHDLKQALKGQPITVLFRGDQLVLQDQTLDGSKTWAILQNLRKNYSFAIALQAKAPPTHLISSPFLLWIKLPEKNHVQSRTWTLRDAIS